MPLNRRGTDAEAVGDPSHGPPLLAKIPKAILIDVRPRAANPNPTTTGGSNPRSDALLQNTAFEFSHGRDNLEQETATWRGGVEGLCDADEVHVAGSKVVERDHHVAERPEKAIRAPHDKRIETATTSITEEAVKLRAAIFRAADAVIDVRVGEAPAAPLDEVLGLIVLEPRILFDPRHPQVPDGTEDHAATTSGTLSDQTSRTENPRGRRSSDRGILGVGEGRVGHPNSFGFGTAW